ncbi:T9SS C-terminal target domain-containing protein [archaeon]|nr:T9SS C-terminal target domain-containing protein [archaeon]
MLYIGLSLYFVLNKIYSRLFVVMYSKILVFLGFIFNLGIVYSQDFKERSFEYDGQNREYSIYVPMGYDGSEHLPLLFNFHGGNDRISNWMKTADMRSLADTANFILVYPQARPDPSDGGSLNWLPKTEGTFDDVYFVNALIDTLLENFQIDENRIYACGYSLGGDMSFELACKLSNRIAAIASVARTMRSDPIDYCKPNHPTGVLTILGTNDFTSPYDGIVFNGVEYYLSAAATHTYWASFNGCDKTPTMREVSTSVNRYTWTTSLGCNYVEELKVNGGGHDWPGSFGNMTINANTEIWNFVSKFNLKGQIGCASNSKINFENKGKIIMSPNPCKSQLRVINRADMKSNYSIYTILGESVLNGVLRPGENKFDLSQLPSNIYIFQVGNKYARLVKD